VALKTKHIHPDKSKYIKEYVRLKEEILEIKKQQVFDEYINNFD
jgi:hypothetical protein